MTVHTEWKMFTGKTGDCRAYIAYMEPVAEPRPAVLIIQEIWGVDAHIRDVAGRFAAAGYVAIAPELFADNGVTPEALSEERLAEAKAFLHSIPHTAWYSSQEREKAILGKPADRQNQLRETLDKLFGLLNPAAQTGRLADILADTAEYARGAYEKTKGMPVASVGFCMGGAQSAVLATRDPLHAGSVVFYGRPPQQGIADIQCPVLGFYGGQDPNITNQIPAFEEEMRKQGKAFEAVVYPDAKHAFYNDTNPTYNVNAARDAFARTLVFLNRVAGQN